MFTLREWMNSRFQSHTQHATQSIQPRQPYPHMVPKACGRYGLEEKLPFPGRDRLAVCFIMGVDENGEFEVLLTDCCWELRLQATNTYTQGQTKLQEKAQEGWVTANSTHAHRQTNPIKELSSSGGPNLPIERLWVNADFLLHFKMYCRRLLNAGSE